MPWWYGLAARSRNAAARRAAVARSAASCLSAPSRFFAAAPSRVARAQGFSSGAGAMTKVIAGWRGAARAAARPAYEVAADRPTADERQEPPPAEAPPTARTLSGVAVAARNAPPTLAPRVAQ